MTKFKKEIVNLTSVEFTEKFIKKLQKKFDFNDSRPIIIHQIYLHRNHLGKLVFCLELSIGHYNLFTFQNKSKIDFLLCRSEYKKIQKLILKTLEGYEKEIKEFYEYPKRQCDESCHYHCSKGGTQKPDCITNKN